MANSNEDSKVDLFAFFANSIVDPTLNSIENYIVKSNNGPAVNSVVK